jgi:hypothetical protein
MTDLSALASADSIKAMLAMLAGLRPSAEQLQA